METFKELGTAAAIARLYENSGFKPCTNPCFEVNDGFAVTASRLLLEGMDFDLTFFPFNHLGYKAVLQATGELFSCLATPATLKVVLGVSSKLDFAEVSQLWEGIVAAARDYGYRSLALELLPSLTGLSISVTATGFDPRENSAKRPVAKSMDLVCLSNNCGASFLGEQILRSAAAMTDGQRTKKLEKYKQLVAAYLHPEMSPYTLSALKDSDINPSFGYFCRNGLKNTIHELSRDSGLGVKIYVDKFPLAGGTVDAANELKLDPLQAALSGGDDNCLLFTIPIGSHEKFRHDFQNWDVIGHLAKPEVGCTLVSPDGLEHIL